jgi:hypothetical protein
VIEKSYGLSEDGKTALDEGHGFIGCGKIRDGDRKEVPQRLKPDDSQSVYGPTKVVP